MRAVGIIPATSYNVMGKFAATLLEGFLSILQLSVSTYQLPG